MGDRAERPSVDSNDNSSYVHVRPMIGGELHESIIPGSFARYTVISHDRQLNQVGEARTIAVASSPEGDEAWLMGEKSPNVSNRIRFLHGGHMEVTHFNGMVPPLQAIYKEEDGIIGNEEILLREGIGVNIPPKISPFDIAAIRATFVTLIAGIPSSYSFTEVKGFAEATDRIGLFTPQPVPSQ